MNLVSHLARGPSPDVSYPIDKPYIYFWRGRWYCVGDPNSCVGSGDTSWNAFVEFRRRNALLGQSPLQRKTS